VTSRISLPVIARLSIRNYSLYPGVHKKGLDLEFPSGVTVLAGINGVGKTTLLNLLMRMLLGPLDRPDADRDLSRISKRELVLNRRFSFFSDRVPEKLGDNAIATLEFTIGRHALTVTRSLNSMALKSVTKNRRRQELMSEIDFANEMARLTGLESGYDFHVVVRYLQFFTEERMPILWSSAIQFEFFKMLFLNRDLVRDINGKFAAIQRLDTLYRNGLNLLKPREKRLEESQAAAKAAAGAGDIAPKVVAAGTAHESASAEFKRHDDIVLKLQTEARTLDLQFNEAEAKLADLEDELQHADAAFIAQALPTNDDKAKFLMAGLSSGQGCFVCGNRHKSQTATVARQLKAGNCFVCQLPITGRGKGAKVEPLASSQIRNLEERIQKFHKDITAIQAQRDANHKAVGPAGQALRLAATRQAETALALATLQALLPTSPESVGALEAELKAERKALEEMDVNRKGLVDEYRALVQTGREQMEAVKEDLREKLTTYAEAFLQETVKVQFGSQDKVKIATGAGQVGMPSFSILMTSSTHEVVKERLTSDNVSESQKEFLDLAFRMTLLDMVCSDGAKTLVIETPEASLDSWFMLRAADLMRRFAPADSEPVRNLIATSNVNGTAMIPALLGRVGKDGKPRKNGKTRGAQFIDLLKVTAKSNTLKDSAARALIDEELERFDD
jgi:AAA domain